VADFADNNIITLFANNTIVASATVFGQSCVRMCFRFTVSYFEGGHSGLKIGGRGSWSFQE